MKSRLLVAAVGVPVLLYVVLCAPVIVLQVGIAALSAVAGYELLRCVEAPKEWQQAAALGALMLVLAICFKEESVAVLIMGYVILFFFCAVLKGGAVKLLTVLATAFASVFIPFALTSFLSIHELTEHRGYLLLPFLFSFGSDTFAFFTGRIIGKRKLAPKVSPNKTVAGAVGGLVGDMLCGLGFAFVMNTYFGQSLGYVDLALMGLFCSVIAQIGDLSFSMIKREFDVKDYGHIFLAHGGVLDRFDSVLFVAPVVVELLPLVL